MAEAETLCGRVAIIDHGQLLAVGEVPELKASLGRDQITRIEGVIPSSAAEAIRALPQVQKATLKAVEGASQLTIVSGNGKHTLPQLIETLAATGAVIQKITPQEITLEDVFIAKTGRTLAEDTRTK